MKKVQSKLGANSGYLSLFLDISGAFHKTWHPLVLKKLIDVNCPKVYLSILKNYLSDRKITLEYGGVSVSKVLSCGCPQGGVLSPFIWNLYIDGLLRMLEDIGIDVQGWADDIVIGFPIVNLKNIESNFQHVLQVLEKIFSWGKDFKGLFNASKTKMVLFHKPSSKFDLKYFSLMTSEGLIKLSSSAILLGVVLDSHFSWTQHIEHIVSKIKRIIFGLIAFVKKHWYVDSKLLKILYNSVIEPTCFILD